MAILDTNHDRAALIILILGAALVVALSPFATGLIGIPVLYVVFAPLHKWLAKRVRPALAAAAVVVTALFLFVVPGVSFAGLIVNQAQAIAGGVIQSPILTRLSQVRIGCLRVGGGSPALGPAHAVFWGVVASVLAVLPVVGSGLVWAPGALALVLDHQYGWALGLTLWGLVVVGNVSYVIQPMVFRRWAQIHPLITLIGALAGVPYFGILGLLIGPLALSYFFELIRMYREE